MSVDRKVDSFRFVRLVVKKCMQAWYPKEPVTEIPWTLLKKPLLESRVALISSAGLVPKGDTPFDQEGERERPWWGDPSFRRIPRDVEEVRSDHLHINTTHLEADLDCVFPLRRLLELQSEGKVGEVAPTHYSFMGYILDATELLQTSVPAMIESLREEAVDAVVLVPV